MEEYRGNVELWKHDDILRQQRTGNFLTVNTILLAALSASVSIRPSLIVLGGASLLLSIFGLSISLTWYSVLTRNAEYVRFRRFQLRSIEARLPGITTFTNTYKAFYKDETISFTGIDDTFKIVPQAKISSTQIESKLSRIVAGFWLFMFIIGVIALIIGSGIVEIR